MTSQLYQPISSSSRTSSESSLNDEVHYNSEEEPKRKLDTQSSVSSEVSFHLILFGNEKNVFVIHVIQHVFSSCHIDMQPRNSTNV